VERELEAEEISTTSRTAIISGDDEFALEGTGE